MSAIIRREEAYRQLGVRPEDATQGIQISPQLRAIAKTIRRAGQPRVTTRILGGGRDDVPTEERTEHASPYGPGSDIYTSWPWYLSTSEDPAARKVLEAYYSIPQIHRTLLPVEAFCIAASISPMRVLELITAACVRIGAQASTIIAAVNHPRVVEKAVEMALTDEGHADRTDLHKAVGFLPTAKGSQTTIQVVQTATASAQQASVVAAPAPEQSIRRLVNRFNESKQLPASAQTVDVLPEDAEIVTDDENDQ